MRSPFPQYLWSLLVRLKQSGICGILVRIIHRPFRKLTVLPLNDSEIHPNHRLPHGLKTENIHSVNYRS